MIERFADMMDRDLSRTTLESFPAFDRLSSSYRPAPHAGSDQVPAMGMYGDRDMIVHPKQWQPMQKGIGHAHIERFPLAGHFPMLEEPKVR